MLTWLLSWALQRGLSDLTRGEGLDLLRICPHRCRAGFRLFAAGGTLAAKAGTTII
jgi:hypothetical protein